MLKRLKLWFLSKILKREYFISVDTSNGKDYSCQVNGYRDAKGVAHITSVEYRR